MTLEKAFVFPGGLNGGTHGAKALKLLLGCVDVGLERLEAKSALIALSGEVIGGLDRVAC